MTHPRIATYRLQLHAEFGFDAAAEVACYLQDLGISHVYCSPYLQAAPGSKHGYDVVDHHRVNDELGGSEAHERFLERLNECNLGQVLDIVPNHMAISGRRNRWWWDVLENGQSSRYSTYFDIDWQPYEEKLRNKLLMPILGDHYGRVLERGEIQVRRRGGDFFVQYADHELPLAPRSLAPILMEAAAETGSDYLAFIADSLARLPKPTLTDRASVDERHRDKHFLSELMERLFGETRFIADSADAVLKSLNANQDRLHEVLEQQTYRLAYWQASKQDLGYRRFFDVNALVGLRMENPQAFSDSHALILRWMHEGKLDGIRIDHPDGLMDPRNYFERLRGEAGGIWLLAEKILEPGETFRASWPLDGTTGYDYLNQAGGLLVDSANEEEFNRIYQDFTGETTDYPAICREKKHLVLRDLLGSDVTRLTSILADLFECHRNRRDYTRVDASRALRELIACFPVYRTYVVPEREEITDEDRRYVDEATEAAKANRQELDAELFDFIRDILLLKIRGKVESEFVMRFQQFTGPAMAKGVEDTVFYCYNRLTSLNEVGGHPGTFGVSVEDFHAFCQEVQSTRPRTMLASSTHDTKRSEDVRARISLLSEIPRQWSRVLECWSKRTEKYKTGECPDRNTEYLIYQTMLGAWPIEPDRLLPYLEKAAREAKRKTSWLAPNEQFEAAMRHFVEAVYRDGGFMESFQRFVEPLVEKGRTNSLALTLLKLTSPGVPDFYQGTELWDLSLVDPDNRRPVDYGKRRALLEELRSLNVSGVVQRADEGLPKLWTIYHALRVRREKPEAFGDDGEYVPLEARGERAEHAVAYLRGGCVLVLAPRLLMKMGPDWSDTELDLPTGKWKNKLTGADTQGGSLPIGTLLKDFPVALLVKQ